MGTGALALAILPLLGGPADPPRLSVPTIEAGAVATIIVRWPAAGATSTAYQLRLEPGFVPLVPEAGSVAALDDAFVLPLTFATPRRLAAGERAVGTVSLAGATGEMVLTLRVRVRARRALHLELDASEIPVRPGGVAAVGYRVRNDGNVTDTAAVAVSGRDGWVVSRVPPVVLEAGETRRGTVQVAAPATARIGSSEPFVMMTGQGDAMRTRRLDLLVVEASGPLGGLAHVPGSLFIGQSLEEGGTPVVALSGAGRVGPDTDLRFDFRHSESVVLEPALQRQMGGPRARVEIERPGMRLAAGELHALRSTISSSQRRARGVRVHGAPGTGVTAAVILATPLTVDGRAGEGRVLQVEGALETGAGRFGAFVGELAEAGAGTTTGHRTSGAGLRWDVVNGSHTGRVETALVRMAAGDSLHRTGPTVDAEYAFSGRPVAYRVRLRTTPGGATTAAGEGNELSAAVTAEVRPGLQLVGSGHRADRDILVRAARDRSSAASLGLRRRAGPLQVQLAGVFREHVLERNDRATVTARRMVRGDVAFTRGRWSVQADGEGGSAEELGQAGPFHAMGAGGRWNRDGRGGWVRIQWTTRPGTLPAIATFQSGGTTSLGPVALSSGGSATIMADRTALSLWSSAAVEVQHHTTVHLGASARPRARGSEWSFSIGASRRLRMPLPLPRHADLHGQVFEDRNGNGRRDAGEPALEGVRLTLGHLQARTDRAGRFAFYDAPDAPLTVDVAGELEGYVPYPGTVLPSRGTVDIPLVRTGVLDLRLFLDRNGDGRWDPAESAAAGAVVTVTDARGARRTAVAGPDGQVRLAGLAPGRYAVAARVGDGRLQEGPDPPIRLELDVEPGETTSATVGVPPHTRAIRMNGGGGADPFR
jgi:hypothetical protein